MNPSRYGILDKSKITAALPRELAHKVNTRIFDELPSTNAEAKRLAREGEPEWTVITAESQSGGYGRYKREFFSPSGTGLYFSVILRPKMPPSDTTLITTAAAVAMSKAIETVFEERCHIKWVNDIFCREKKVCGILTEAGCSAEAQLDYAILGLGVDIYPPEGGFPDSISSIAGSIADSPVADGKSRLLCEFLTNFYEYYSSLAKKSFLSEYKARLMWVGKEIRVIKGDVCTPATLLGVDDELRLTVRYKDGSAECLSSAEVGVDRHSDQGAL